MFSNKYGEQQICQKHNLPQQFENPDKSKPNQLYVCNHSINEYQQLIPIKPIQGIFKQFEEQLDQNSQNIIDEISDQIQQAPNEFKNLNINQKEGIQQAHESYLQTQLNQRNIIQQTEELKQNSQDKLIQGSNEINLQQLNQDDEQQKINNVEIQQLKVKRYEYQLVPESTIKQEVACLAIALNYDGSIIVAGCERIIKVFEFKNKQLKEVQSLKSHEFLVCCLKFMKKSNQFISGSLDNTIKIWQENQNQYINIQTLEEHKNNILCLITNSNDDLIVSGSKDESIIFWELNGNKWQLDQQIQCSSEVYSLSFNDSNTKLISCEVKTIIQVFQLEGKKWIISQKIQLQESGFRLCFFSDDQFVFLPRKGEQLHFYKLDQQTNQFEKQLEVEANSGSSDAVGFPLKFIRSKNLLIVKNCQFVNIFRKQEQGNFIQDQAINFKSSALSFFLYTLYGDVSEDGNFMVTWDSETREYQVRYLKEIE